MDDAAGVLFLGANNYYQQQINNPAGTVALLFHGIDVRDEEGDVVAVEMGSLARTTQKWYVL